MSFANWVFSVMTDGEKFRVEVGEPPVVSAHSPEGFRVFASRGAYWMTDVRPNPSVLEFPSYESAESCIKARYGADATIIWRANSGEGRYVAPWPVNPGEWRPA